VAASWSKQKIEILKVKKEDTIIVTKIESDENIAKWENFIYKNCNVEDFDNGLSINNAWFLGNEHKVDVLSTVETAKKLYRELMRTVWLNDIFKDERDRLVDSDLNSSYEDYFAQELEHIDYCFYCGVISDCTVFPEEEFTVDVISIVKKAKKNV